MLITVLGGSGHGHVEALVVELKVAAYEVDTAFHHGQSIVGLASTEVAIEADTNHSVLSAGQIMINEILTTESLEMAAIKLKHAGVCGIEIDHVHVGGLTLEGGDKDLKDLTEPGAVPAGLR